jgi:hypothetical protein
MNDKTYFAIMLRADNVTWGYVLDAYPEERVPYLAEIAQTREQVIGEYRVLSDAEAALTLAMTPPAGHA